MDVGIRELKQHLSEYLDRAASGEVVRVTDRGVPKVVIAAVPGAAALERGVDEGWLTPPRHAEGVGPARRVRASRRVAEVLGEDRGA